MKEVYLINEEGEIIKSMKADTIEDILNSKENTQKRIDRTVFFNYNKTLKNPFFFYNFKEQYKLMQVLSPKEFLSFLFLCSFANSNGQLVKKNNRTYITTNDIKLLLNASERGANKIIKTLKDNNLIYIYDNNVYINTSVASFGGMKNFNDTTGSIRIYKKSLQELSYKYSLNDLFILFQLIPYIDYETNAIIDTTIPHEKGFKKLNIKDIARVTKRNYASTRNCLQRVRMMKFNNNNVLIKKDTVLYINPLLFYRGNSMKLYNKTLTYFTKK